MCNPEVELLNENWQNLKTFRSFAEVDVLLQLVDRVVAGLLRGEPEHRKRSVFCVATKCEQKFPKFVRKIALAAPVRRGQSERCDAGQVWTEMMLKKSHQKDLLPLAVLEYIFGSEVHFWSKYLGCQTLESTKVIALNWQTHKIQKWFVETWLIGLCCGGPPNN